MASTWDDGKGSRHHSSLQNFDSSPKYNTVNTNETKVAGLVFCSHCGVLLDMIYKRNQCPRCLVRLPESTFKNITVVTRSRPNAFVDQNREIVQWIIKSASTAQEESAPLVREFRLFFFSANLMCTELIFFLFLYRLIDHVQSAKTQKCSTSMYN
jgi:hypothetical protein